MSGKKMYAYAFFFILSLFLFFYLQNSQTGVIGQAARENRLLPLRAVQAFVIYRVATEDQILGDQLLPDSMKNDPWGTPYESRCSDERFYVHSAGPDKMMMNRPLKPCDDILIFKSCVVDCSASLSDLNDMLYSSSEPLIAEVLLNCDDAFYQDAARNWITAHGYNSSLGVSLGQEIW